MNNTKLGFFAAALTAAALSTSTASAGDDILDKAEDAWEQAQAFKNSDCGGALSGCWSGVNGAFKKKNKACKAFRTCKRKCRSGKRVAKKACMAERKCSRKRGKAKRACKRSCRKGARMVKRSCVKSKCGKRPAACSAGWRGVASAFGKCFNSIKDSDCKKWANDIQSQLKK